MLRTRAESDPSPSRHGRANVRLSLPAVILAFAVVGSPSGAGAQCSPPIPPYDIFWRPAHHGQANLVTAANAAPVGLYHGIADCFSQVPGQWEYFLGRNLESEEPFRWSLTLARMADWENYRLDLVKHVVLPPVTIQRGQYHLVSAHDPSVVSYGGELWVAFECRLQEQQPGLSTCIGPLTADLDLDRQRTAAVVLAAANGSVVRGASVPKIFTHQDRLYLYWTQVVRDGPYLPDGASTVAIRALGVELEQEPGGDRRLWPAGKGHAIPTTSAAAVEVWAPGADTGSNVVVDIFDARSDGAFVYATAGVGGEGCKTPWSQVEGCYRLAVARSPTALGSDVFQDRVPETDLPLNGHEYSRFFQRPGGGLMLMADFVAPVGTTRIVPAGQRAFRLPPPCTCTDGNPCTIDICTTTTCIPYPFGAAPACVAAWLPAATSLLDE